MPAESIAGSEVSAESIVPDRKPWEREPKTLDELTEAWQHHSTWEAVPIQLLGWFTSCKRISVIP